MRRLSLALAAAALLCVPAPATARSLDFENSLAGSVTFPQPSDLSGANGMTVMLWVEMDNVAVRTYFMNDSAAITFDFRIDNAIGGGGLAWSHLTGGGTASTEGTPTVGVWTHIAARYDRTLAAGDRTRFYINGVLQNITTDPTADAAIGSATGTLRVGDTITTTPNGRLADARIFKVALTQQQIEAEMRCARPQETSSLVFWAPFNEGDKTIPDVVRGIPGTPNTGISTSDSTPPVELCGAGG